MTEPIAAPIPAGPSPASPVLHFDEVHDAAGQARPHWQRLQQELLAADRATLLRAQDQVRRMRRNQGTLPEAARRPAGGGTPIPHAALRALDPIPHLLSAPEWAHLEAGLRQRARLLDQLLADVYGPRRLVERGILPGEVVYAYAGFLRPCAGLPVPRRLVTAAVDLARAPDGAWRVRGDRASVPRGLGGMLSARRVLARLHPELYRALQVQRVDSFYDTLRSTLAGLGEGLPGRARDGDGPTRTVILSPGPDAPAFPEHTYLARSLGYTMVSGTDLTVRHGQVTVRSVGGLEPADVVLRLVDDAWCDPLELRPDSLLGPPGLIEATRRSRVALANALGTGFLEHPALGAFLPAVSEALLGEDLLLAPVPAWWCGDDASRAEVLADLDRVILRPLTPDAWPHQPFPEAWEPHQPFPEAIPGTRLFPRLLPEADREALRAAVEHRPGSWAAEEYSEASTAPVVHDGHLVAGRLVLRCFVVADGDDWEVLPGGLGRVKLLDSVGPPRIPGRPGEGALVVRKDVWALAATPHRLAGPVLTLPQIDLGASLPSRNAEALYWMGRHAEAAETAIRVVQTISAELGETPELATDAAGAWVAMFSASLRWTFESPRTPGEFPVHRARRATALGAGTLPPPILRRVLVDESIPRSLVGSLADLLQASLSARELVSTHTGQVLAMLEDRLGALRAASAPAEIEEIAGSTLINLMALVGLSAESMVRDPGYLMSDIGRRVERARLLVRILLETLVPVPHADIAGLTHETILACCESLVSYRRRYRSDIEVDALSSLLITDPGNPRSLAFQADRLMADLRRLPGEPPERALQSLGSVLERLLMADLGRLLTPVRGRRSGLRTWLWAISTDLEQVAEAVSLTYFAHVPVQPVDLLFSQVEP
ncbi:MAG TPA: circularly permuted type 2 ATP-grasp protein [Acidimicrobiia bacterium]|nr:circularly permuted type 2 ATP-grasp protein [Acidimicrobiia bacterium]